MKKTITFEIELPIKATRQELEEWLEFNLDIVPNLSESNPLGRYDDWNELKIDKLHIMEPEKIKWI